MGRASPAANCNKAPFRRRIGHPPGAAADAEGAADIDDLAVALADHGRQYAAHGVKRAVHIERHDGVEFLRRGLDAGLADRSRAARDIDQNVDAAAELLVLSVAPPRHIALHRRVQHRQDAYPGVNAVTLMEMQDPVDPRQAEIIPVVRYSAARRAARGGDYWDHATLAELAVLARDREGAMDAMASALAQPNPEAFWYPTTADNLSKIVTVRRARGEEVGWITELEDYLRASAAAQSGAK